MRLVKKILFIFLIILLIIFVLIFLANLILSVGTISDRFYRKLPEMNAENCISQGGRVESPQLKQVLLGAAKMQDVCGGKFNYLGRVTGALCHCVCCK